MARTAKDDLKRGPLSYGKGTRNRGYGYEWNALRLGGRGWREPGRFTKRETHRYERRIAKRLTLDDAA